MKNKSVGRVILNTIKEKWMLTAGIAITVVGAIVMALFPPLILAKIIDTVASGTMPTFYMVLMYFGFLLVTGFMESARETFLTVFGQKITHSLRSALMYKYSCLTTSGLTSQEPGTVVSRFVGDADTVENFLGDRCGPGGVRQDEKASGGSGIRGGSFDGAPSEFLHDR